MYFVRSVKSPKVKSLAGGAVLVSKSESTFEVYDNRRDGARDKRALFRPQQVDEVSALADFACGMYLVCPFIHAPPNVQLPFHSFKKVRLACSKG